MTNDGKTKSSNLEFSKISLLFIVGFIVIFVGIIVLVFTTIFYGGDLANFGAVIFIGPIPLVIGVGPESTWIVLFAIILAILCVMMFFIMCIKWKQKD